MSILPSRVGLECRPDLFSPSIPKRPVFFFYLLCSISSLYRKIIRDEQCGTSLKTMGGMVVLLLAKHWGNVCCRAL